MTKSSNKKKRPQPAVSRTMLFVCAGITIAVAAFVFLRDKTPSSESDHRSQSKPSTSYMPTELWLQRAYAVKTVFQQVYTPGWEGAYGAMGMAYMFAVTGDSALLRFHTIEKPLLNFDNGYWVDDRAWAALAELLWWEVTDKRNALLVLDAIQRYDQARVEGRLSNHEGYWTWYNWPQNAQVKEPIFTNSNMNQMVTVACKLYEATKQQRFLDDALLVWNGDKKYRGIEKTLYKGNGKWIGKHGRAAFGKELPWGGTEYCSIGAAMFRVTGVSKYREIVVATAKRIMDPRNGWVDSTDFFQIHMDGNGAFVHFLLDAYMLAPDELSDIPAKVEKMLEHVWTNHNGKAKVLLHRTSDHGIRNGWNPNGGEDGYGVGEVGTVHAQGEALRAFGVFAYIKNRRE